MLRSESIQQDFQSSSAALNVWSQAVRDYLPICNSDVPSVDLPRHCFKAKTLNFSG